MGRNNSNIEEEIDIEDSEEEGDEIEEDDSNPLEYQRHEGNNEGINEKPTIDNFFNTEQLLQDIEKTMKGFQKKGGEWSYTTLPKSRDNFINTTMNSLRSVINQQNMISKMGADEIKNLLLEKNYEFIFLIYDESSVEDEDVETAINIFDHALQLFMGQVEDGHGARTFKQVSAAVAYETEARQKDDSLISLGWGDKNLVKIGGNNK
jgi:hypothetical protein